MGGGLSEGEATKEDPRGGGGIYIGSPDERGRKISIKKVDREGECKPGGKVK